MWDRFLEVTQAGGTEHTDTALAAHEAAAHEASAPSLAHIGKGSEDSRVVSLATWRLACLFDWV